MHMKEIISVIRPKRVAATKEALVKLGYPSLTALPVLGRGRQKGLENEVITDFRPGIPNHATNRGMKYVPKRYLSVVVRDEAVDAVVDAIVKANQTGQIGDGKIFVCPVDNALRIRTDEQGSEAID